MHVETESSGTELLAFAGTGLTLLAGVLPWVAGGTTAMQTAAGLTALCGLAAGAVLLYGGDDARDHAALLGVGLTVTASAVRAHGRITAASRLTGIARSPGIGVFLAALAGLALAGAAAYECWERIAVEGARGPAGAN